jgi:hypothetical protein
MAEFVKRSAGLREGQIGYAHKAPALNFAIVELTGCIAKASNHHEVSSLAILQVVRSRSLGCRNGPRDAECGAIQI